jgi:hypothetical protein
MVDPTYSCPKSETTLRGEWNEKWYSPVCRGWYKQTKENWDPVSKRGIITDLYLYAGVSTLGLTLCAPISKYTYDGDASFGGAMCLDIAPEGKLNNYFDF